MRGWVGKYLPLFIWQRLLTKINSQFTHTHTHTTKVICAGKLRSKKMQPIH